MDYTYWYKQGDQPLFPDILWSRPESRQSRGKLAIVGGNSHGFGAPGIAYNCAQEAGVGITRVVLPDSIRKTVANLLPDADYTPSTPSGSFSKQAVGELLAVADWADCVLLAGDFGRNSETAILMESFVQKTIKPLVTTQDNVDYFKDIPLRIVNRPQTLLVLSMSQLQKVFINTPTITPITLSMSTIQLVEALHGYTLVHPAIIVTKHNELVFVATQGRVSTTKHTERIWRVKTAARASVFWLQNIDKPFEAITTSLNAGQFA